MKRRFLLVLAVAALSACSGMPSVSPDLPARGMLQDFSLEGRFALRVAQGGEVLQQASGRLAWVHQNDQDRIFLSNPLGAGLAEIDMKPGFSRLRSANGKTYEHADADVLLQQVTGYELPVTRLAPWLLGHAGVQGIVLRDHLGRPQSLREAGWQIEYFYPDEAADGLPFRLNINRASEVSLILRIEEWREAP